MSNLTENIKNTGADFKNQIQNKVDEETTEEAEESSAASENPDEFSPDEKRSNLIKNFENKDSDLEDVEKAKQNSYKDSQGVADHSGSSVHGAGKNMDGKTNSSMWQRNFNNHEKN